MPATAPPVQDMWIGPLGLMHRMAERGTWERTPDLGVSTHVSLHGQVTASRALWSPRTTTLSWARLPPADADALAEIALVPARDDATVAVIDPDAAAGNLFTPEQSRGRPLKAAAAAGIADLYQIAVSGGALLTGSVAGERFVVVQDGAATSVITWLHPYHGIRGWPLMGGWPVYLSVADVPGGPGVHHDAQLRLTFLSHTGAVVGAETGDTGTGVVAADAPATAVYVVPTMVIATGFTGLRLLGRARLTYAPQDASIPLGNGCPAYAVTSLSDTPELPYRSTSLALQEVRAYATR